MKVLSQIILIAGLLLGAHSNAESWFEKKSGGVFIYDKFKKHGVPQRALERLFEFLDINEFKQLPISLAEKKIIYKEISNKNYAVIIDYSVPSNQKRLFLLNLKNGSVEKYYVAHGLNSGEKLPTRFSNKVDSKQTSLGIYLTGSNYRGSHGNSLYLHGLESSNNRAYERDIVMHGADYISMKFLNKYGRMGRSWGCPAVSREINKKLIPLIRQGALLYAYHKDLMPMAQTSPTVQEMSEDKHDTPRDSNNVVPEEIDQGVGSDGSASDQDDPENTEQQNT